MIKPIITLSLTLTLFATGCQQKEVSRIQSVNLELNVPLSEQEESSPACKFTANLVYLNVLSQDDSIAIRINEEILASSLGEKYKYLPAIEALDSFKNEYIKTYQNEVYEFYQEDLKKSRENQLPISSWYNYEYMLTTKLEDGKEGVFNYSTTTMEYRGGAHPNEFSKWINFSKSSGTILSFDDLFVADSRTAVSNLILEALIAEMAEKLSDPTIQTINDLQTNGILSYTQIYVPDNFLLKNEGICFLYNKYDIAPYSMGAITVSIPYDKLEQYLIH
ncbi:MAG: RsiV family protein [Phocaeicola sp.]